MAQIKSVGQVMAMSGMFPDIAKDGAKAFVKILAGQEMGIPPFEAMGGISIIQGKATVGGNLMAAKVKASPKYDYKIKERTNKGCSIEFFELNGAGRVSLGIETFDEDDAKAAQLAGKDMWKKYPKNMYFNRAISNGVRTFCPDVLGAGPVYTPEEMGAVVDEEGNAVIEAGMTYSQDKPAAALPEITEDPKPAEADEPLPTESPLLLISNDLASKGFAEKEDRGKITLRVAGVTSFGQRNTREWHEIYKQIKAMDAATAGSFLDDIDESADDQPPEEPTPPQQPDEVAEVTDTDIEAVKQGTLLDDVAETFPGAVNTSTGEVLEPKGAVEKPTGRQMAKLKSLYIKNALKTTKQQENFNMSVIEKKYPLTPEDFDALIKELTSNG